MTLANLLIIVWYDEAWALITGRLLIGLPYGIVYVTLVSHAGENSVPEVRGRVVAGLGLMQAIGVLLFLLANMSYDYYSSIDGNLLVGILSLLWALVGAVLTKFLTYESVAFMMQAGHTDVEVTSTMCKLRNESSLTWSVQNDLDELKRHLADESGRLDAAPWRHGNGRPLLVVAVLHVISFLTNNVVLNAVQIGFVRTMWPAGGPTNGALVLAAVRVAAMVVPVCLVDKFGRKAFVNVLAAGGIVQLVLAVVLTTVDQRGIAALLVLVALMHALFGGGGADAMPHVVAAEAFALHKKSWSLALTAAVEHVLHVASVAVLLALPGYAAVFYAIMYVSAGMIVGLAVLLVYVMPETRAMTLAQSRDEFAGAGGVGVVYASVRAGGAPQQSEQGITYSNAAVDF